MSRRNNVNLWHVNMKQLALSISICKFLFPCSFVVWMWKTGYQVCHYRDVISKVRRLFLLRGKFYLYSQIFFQISALWSLTTKYKILQLKDAPESYYSRINQFAKGQVNNLALEAGCLYIKNCSHVHFVRTSNQIIKKA